METYVQCPYCLGYNTCRIPLLKEIDGSININAPEYIERFPKTNCIPQSWMPIIKQEKYNLGGFCNHCQATFLVKPDLIVKMESASKERWLKEFSMQVEGCFHVDSCGKNTVVTAGRIIDG